LTQVTSEQKPSVSADASPSVEKIAERKTIVYETHTDPTVIRLASEKNKDRLFSRFGFMKPKPEEILFVSIEKYYEPYMIINGEYYIDYYRKCCYTVNIGKEVQEVILFGQTYDLSRLNDQTAETQKSIKLEGEERLINDVSAALILDRSGRDVTLEKLPSAPSERNPQKILQAFGVEEIGENSDLDFIRAKLVQRPKDISRVVNELFEVSERAVIYTPRFRVVYRNLRTNEEKVLEYDGVTAQQIGESKRKGPSAPPPPPPPT